MSQRIEKCVAKLGEPDIKRGMRVCGEPCEYQSAMGFDGAGNRMFSGWYHVDRSLTADHHAVPESMIR